MIWKRCPHYWPFMRGILRSPVDSTLKGPDMRILDCWLQQTVEKTIDRRIMKIKPTCHRVCRLVRYIYWARKAHTMLKHTTLSYLLHTARNITTLNVVRIVILLTEQTQRHLENLEWAGRTFKLIYLINKVTISMGFTWDVITHPCRNLSGCMAE